jgi:cell division topological specificity factor
MSFIDTIFGKKDKSANKAKDRLKIMLAHERAQNSYPFMDDMRQDIIEVIKKYIPVENVHISTQKSGEVDLLEVEVTLSKN